MQKELINTLIGRVLSGEASPLEKRQLKDWMSESSENLELFQNMQAAWNESHFKYGYQRQNEVFNRISQDIHADIALAEERSSAGKSRINWYRYAATIIILISFAVALLWVIRENPTSAGDQSEALITKSIPIGNKLKFYLPDGSTVWLNADSKLQYPENFEGDQRVVQLEGEAFFSVVRDTLKPFIVQTGSFSTRVLGTSFNISALAQYNEIKVAVATGLVSVADISEEKEGGRTILKPNQMAVYSKATKSLETKTCDIESITSWKDGIIVFKDANMNQVVSELRTMVWRSIHPGQ